MFKASDELLVQLRKKLALGRYTANEILQIVSHVTEKSFEKMTDKEKNQEKFENYMPLMTDDPSNALQLNATKMKQTVGKVAGLTSKNFFVQNHVGMWCEHSASKKTSVWNATQELTQNVQYDLSSESLKLCFAIKWFFGYLPFWLRFQLYFGLFYRFRSYSRSLIVFWSLLPFQSLFL